MNTSTTYRLSSWTHPKTGEVRIYVNGLPAFMGRAKVFFTQGDRDFPMVDVKGRYFTSRRTVEDLINDIVNETPRTFSGMLAIANGNS